MTGKQAYDECGTHHMKTLLGRSSSSLKSFRLDSLARWLIAETLLLAYFAKIKMFSDFFVFRFVCERICVETFLTLNELNLSISTSYSFGWSLVPFSIQRSAWNFTRVINYLSCSVINESKYRKSMKKARKELNGIASEPRHRQLAGVSYNTKWINKVDTWRKRTVTLSLPQATHYWDLLDQKLEADVPICQQLPTASVLVLSSREPFLRNKQRDLLAIMVVILQV